MALTALQLQALINWTLDTPITGFADSIQADPGQAFNIASIATAEPIFDLLLASNYSIASGGGTQTYDLFSFNDLQGNAASFSENGALSLYILPLVGNVVLSPGAANPLTWFFGGTTPTVMLTAGGVFVFSLPPVGPGQTVDATHRNLTLTNNGASTASGYFFAVGG